MAQQASGSTTRQQLPCAAPQQYMTSSPVFWSYHYDAKPAARQEGTTGSPYPNFEEPNQGDMNALLAHAMYDSIKANYSYILQTQYNYGVDKDGNVWASQGYFPVQFAPERTRASQLGLKVWTL
ncbi:hypothetical protein CSUI_002925 [Cystoisospora suis]|uniref:Uncharacterized protein n=1 Tax=Cystoisospora suis TaxID=483139 RepID=A0A2C6L2S8_9APIC|nr:hypothetical protein CSUI_002925 [Cystoisospora suis]